MDVNYLLVFMIAFWLSVLLTRQYKRLLGLILLCMQNTQYFVPSLVRCRNMKSQLHTTTSSYMGYKGCKPGVCVFSLSPLIHNVFIHSDASTVYTHRNTQTRLTESSGGLCILIHSTDGPFTCRNLWKRFLKPSKSFLDTWKTQFFYLFIFLNFILFNLYLSKNNVPPNQCPYSIDYLPGFSNFEKSCLAYTVASLKHFFNFG